MRREILNGPMEITNRDLVFALALVAVALVVVGRPGARASVGSMVPAARPFLGVVVTFSLYYAVVVIAAAQVGLWNFGLLKDTLAWYLLGGLVLLFQFTKTYEERGFVRRTARRLIWDLRGRGVPDQSHLLLVRR